MSWSLSGKYGMVLRKGNTQVCIDTRIITMSPCSKRNYRLFLSYLFHELAHITCADSGLYHNYHNVEPTNSKELQTFRRVAFKAERFVDKKAEELMSVYFPDIPFRENYTEDDKSWFYMMFLDKYYKKDKFNA